MSCEFIRVDDTAFLNDMTANLDAVIRSAAQNAGVTYIDVYDAFNGHELCTGQSYLHGIDKSDAAFEPRDAFFHPNVDGQHRYRDLLLNAVAGSGGSVQALSAAGAAPTMSGNAATVSAGSSFTFTAEGYGPNAEVQAVLDWGSASQTILGTTTTDEQGRASATVVIPETTLSGLHSVTAWGVNGDGHSVGPSTEITITDAEPAGS